MVLFPCACVWGVRTRVKLFYIRMQQLDRCTKSAMMTRRAWDWNTLQQRHWDSEVLAHGTSTVWTFPQHLTLKSRQRRCLMLFPTILSIYDNGFASSVTYVFFCLGYLLKRTMLLSFYSRRHPLFCADCYIKLFMWFSDCYIKLFMWFSDCYIKLFMESFSLHSIICINVRMWNAGWKKIVCTENQNHSNHQYKPTSGVLKFAQIRYT